MAWVIGIFCGLLFLGLLFRFPAQTIGLIALIGGGIWLFIDTTTKNNARQYEQARALVTSDQLDFGDLRLSSNYGSWKVTGTATNRSIHTITQIEMQIALQNCPTETTCVTVGQSTASDYITIPPNQMRAIDTYVTFSNLPALDKWNWNYRVTGIAAK